ncbi:hypothetical protein EDB82DRAFT_311223 [Fusarium venenatum]|uniref:uncharacterized protein n=1 Tax=Fusarium venenatum TaxID=56646 RepID=UPI001D7C3206|nr:hypothetical protein EDB82DRAFT_311223 [Fusarium venenatum]
MLFEGNSIIIQERTFVSKFLTKTFHQPLRPKSMFFQLTLSMRRRRMDSFLVSRPVRPFRSETTTSDIGHRTWRGCNHVWHSDKVAFLPLIKPRVHEILPQSIYFTLCNQTQAANAQQAPMTNDHAGLKKNCRYTNIKATNMPVKETPTKGPVSGTSTPYKFENESLGLGLVESFFVLHGTTDLVAPKASQHFFLGHDALVCPLF